MTVEARATSKSAVVSIKIDPEYASAVSKMSPKEYERLKQNIDDEGLHYPLTVNKDYVLLDGHHRYKACQELGIPITENDIVVKDFDPVKEERFVQSINLIRRHLTPFQEAEAVYEIEKLEAEEATKRQKLGKKIDDITLRSHKNKVEVGQARNIAIKKYGASISPSTYSRAKKIIECGTAEVKQGLRENKRQINTEYKVIQKQEKKHKLLAEAANIPRLPDGVKLFHTDFTKIGEKEIPSNSQLLLCTDPPYDEASLPLYKELGKLAMRVLQPGGSLVTYVGEGYADIAMEYLKASGLKWWTFISIQLMGPHTSIHFRKVFAYSKTLLWFVKGDRLREGIPPEYMPNFIVSTPPEKLLHNKGWGQSTAEAEHVIRYLTFPNECVCDPMMGEGTTGKAAINLGRQFIGCEIDREEYESADSNIKRHIKNREESSQ